MGGNRVIQVLVPFVLLASVWLVLESSGVHAQIQDTGAKTVEWALKYSSHSQKLRGASAPDRRLQNSEQKEGGGAGSSAASRFIVQLIYGAIYYCLVVTKYPDLTPNDDKSKAADIQSKSECQAMFSASCTNIFLSWCCTGPRAAHTFDKTGVLNYWIGLLAMTFCPCPTLCWANAFTDLNEKLGGEPRDMGKACCCALFCGCCVVAQDAQALDDITSVHVGCCGVSQDGPE